MEEGRGVLRERDDETTKRQDQDNDGQFLLRGVTKGFVL